MDLQKFKDKMQTENALPLNILLDEAPSVHKNGFTEVDAAGEFMQDIVDKLSMIKMISKDLRTGTMPVDDNPVKLTYNKVICIEELTELAAVIIDYESYCSGSDADADETVREHHEKLINKKYALLEEFADVTICLHLMKKAYGLTDEMISKAVRIKLDNFKKKKEKIMTLKEFAQKLNGREYGWPQFTKEDLAIAKENGFIIVHGASDDLMEIDGAINDEGDCFDGGTLKLDIADGKFVDSDDEESFDVVAIEARWCKGHDNEMNVIPWTYATSVPHEKFMIYEDGKPYCQGIVFQNDALREPAAVPKTVEIELSREQFEKLKTVNSGNRARFYCKETRECFTLYND